MPTTIREGAQSLALGLWVGCTRCPPGVEHDGGRIWMRHELSWGSGSHLLPTRGRTAGGRSFSDLPAGKTPRHHRSNASRTGRGSHPIPNRPSASGEPSRGSGSGRSSPSPRCRGDASRLRGHTRRRTDRFEQAEALIRDASSGMPLEVLGSEGIQIRHDQRLLLRGCVIAWGGFVVHNVFEFLATTFFTRTHSDPPSSGSPSGRGRCWSGVARGRGRCWGGHH